MIIDYKQAAGVVCTATGTIMADLSANEVLYTVSLVLTIIGTIWTLIVWPLIQHFRKAKQNDGKIDAKEISEGLDILNDGIEKTKEEIDKNTKK